MILNTVQGDLSFKICSGIYPIIGLLLGVTMIIAYTKSKNNKLVKPFAFIPAFGLLYGLIYTFAYCIASITSGVFDYIYIIRSFEGFIIDFIIWFIIFTYSICPPNSSKNRGKKFSKKAIEDNLNSSEMSEDEKMEITNF